MEHISLDGDYQLFSRSAKYPDARLSPLGYEAGYGPLSSYLARREAIKITKHRAVAQSFNGLFLIYEGGPFELGVALELAKRSTGNQILFNFHASRYWDIESKKPSVVTKLAAMLANSPNIILSAESGSLATKLSSALQTRVHEFPVFTTLNEQLASEKRLSVSNKHIELLTVVGDRKMVTSAKKMLEQLGKLEPNTRLHIHWSGRDFEESALPSAPRLTQSYGEQSPREYAELLQASKNMLLLYPQERYKFHSSGRIEDALLFGANPIVPEGTALARQNGNTLSTFREVSDIPGLLRQKKQQLATAMDTEKFIAWLQAVATPGKHKPKADEPVKIKTLRLRSPLSGKTTVDKLSIIRIRLGFSESSVKWLRSIARKYILR